MKSTILKDGPAEELFQKNVKTNKSWMNFLAPVAHSFFK